MKLYKLNLFLHYLLILLIDPKCSLLAQQNVPDFLNIIKHNNEYFWSIPNEHLGKDFMLVTRLGGNYKTFYAGDQVNEQVLRFEKRGDSIVMLESLDDRLISPNGSYSVYKKVNQHSFRIYSNPCQDANRYVIKATEYVHDPSGPFFLLNDQQLARTYLPKESAISQVYSYQSHLEIEAIRTFRSEDGKGLSLKFYTSLILLPAEKMAPRVADMRLNYFTKKLPSENKDKVKLAITRWKLTPLKGKMQDYLAGKLVEPEKPIVFYLDPSIPARWRPYFIEGVNAWQKAFEKAGFRNAIYARLAPGKKEDPEWSLYSSHYNAILFQDAEEPNSSYSTIVDPRSGEILECHVRMFRGIFKWFQQLYFAQVSASDTNGRKIELDTDILGRCIKMIVAHEVGHALGLDHNMIASNAVPVEKLRSKAWLLKNGLTPSIMDYARFNYVAQPEDSIHFEKGLINSIGQFDEWAIEWGYRLTGMNDTTEVRELRKWIRNKQGIKAYRTCDATSGDPRAVEESLGDDAVLAGKYGIRNLQFIMTYFTEWTKENNDTSISEIYKVLVKQYQHYLEHVSVNIGGLYESFEEDGNIMYRAVPPAIQLASFRFLEKNLFQTPTWLLSQELPAIANTIQKPIIRDVQSSMLSLVLQERRLRNLLYYSKTSKSNPFGIHQFLEGLRVSIFSDIYSKQVADDNRENLQLLYIKKLSELNKSYLSRGFVVTAPPITKEERQMVNKTIGDELRMLRNDIEQRSAKMLKTDPKRKHYARLIGEM